MKVAAAVAACACAFPAAFGAPSSFDFDFLPGGNAADRPSYMKSRGFGFEPANGHQFSVRVPEGSYAVTLHFADSGERRMANILAEQRRLMLENVPAGEATERTILVNVRMPELAALPANATGGTRVALKPREVGSLSWDDKLSIEIQGGAKLRSLHIAPVDLPTLYLAGDSTVTDQADPPWASWGQMLPRFFGSGIVIANHAESGETLKSFVTELRLDKLLSTLKPGDWVMIQFGHNDQKVQWPQTYADAATTYRSWLRTYIAEVRRRDATPLLVTPPERRNFDAMGKIVPTLADYAEAMRAVAKEESVALIDLNPLSVRFYEALGPVVSPRAFAEDGRDKTHHNEYGAYALARMVVEGLRSADPQFTAHLETHLAADAEPAVSTMTVNADKPGSVINPAIYGQFAEHLGRLIYEGIWVGEKSPIPNTRGYRNDVIAALKELGVPVLRWPGGCFADEYHWRDGIGDKSKRPRKVNTNWGGVVEDNSFGTHEFMDFAELIGAETYVNGNVGTGTPQEMADWLEYMTSDTDSTLAQLRRQNGRDKPWKVNYFAVGNETWGCGGNMRPEYYADLYRHYVTFLKANPSPLRIASGSNGSGLQWTEVLMREATKQMDAISVHYYTLPTGKWDVKGSATKFTEKEWYATVNRSLQMNEILTNHSKIMDKYDPEKRVGLYVDEWGTWYDTEPGDNPGFLYQQNTLRDAMVAAVTLNIFHRHADRVRMTNIAQMVNVLQAMILTDKERMVLTPTYHVYHMYKPFRGATTLQVNASKTVGEIVNDMPMMTSVSAARGTDGRVHIALANSDLHEGSRMSIKVEGAKPRGFTGQILTAAAMDTHNTFDKPDAVKPAALKNVRVKDGVVQIDIPPKSIIVLSETGK